MQRTQHTKDMKKATVLEWFKRFKDCRSNISDDARLGRPAVITLTFVALLETFIEEDRQRQALREIIADFDETWYRNMFSAWIYRHQRCIQFKDDFIEKL